MIPPSPGTVVAAGRGRQPRGRRAPLDLELQEPSPRQSSLVADELGPQGLHERGGAHLADAEGPLDVPPGEEWSHRGFAGTVEVLSASRRTGRLAAAWTGSRGRQSAGTSTRRLTRLWPRLAGCASGSTSGPRAAVPGLDASVSTSAAGAAASSSTTSPAARFRAPEGRGELVAGGRQTSGPAWGSPRSQRPFPRSGGRGQRRPSRHRHVPRCSPPFVCATDQGEAPGGAALHPPPGRAVAARQFRCCGKRDPSDGRADSVEPSGVPRHSRSTEASPGPLDGVAHAAPDSTSSARRRLPPRGGPPSSANTRRVYSEALPPPRLPGSPDPGGFSTFATSTVTADRVVRRRRSPQRCRRRPRRRSPSRSSVVPLFFTETLDPRRLAVV